LYIGLAKITIGYREFEKDMKDDEVKPRFPQSLANEEE